ncbi:MAG TPA: TfoX/Sxy family protein [Kofleriaceae bacterium]|nr:TfoX/Sxy family protein [Kofleriaceae bacterium]
MAYDEKLAARVRKILSQRRGVVEKTVMGRLAFMVNDSMCCSVGRDGILVRVTPKEREKVLARAHVTPMTLGKRVMKGFVRVDPAGYRTDTALATWIERGIAAASAARR